MIKETVRFIGDVHGKFNRYETILKDCPANVSSIQVGDMGVGFFKQDKFDGTLKASANPPYDLMVKGDHKFIRGNHDNPAVCKRHTQWIPDATMHKGVFCIGGGLSIDRAYRTDGIDYWSDEELSYQDFQKAIGLYEELKPRYVVSHDGPEEVCRLLFDTMKHDYPSITRTALQEMYKLHQPEYWFFGYWHMPRIANLNGTQFVCIPELNHVDLEIEY